MLWQGLEDLSVDKVLHPAANEFSQLDMSIRLGAAQGAHKAHTTPDQAFSTSNKAIGRAEIHRVTAACAPQGRQQKEIGQHSPKSQHIPSSHEPEHLSFARSTLVERAR